MTDTSNFAAQPYRARSLAWIYDESIAQWRAAVFGGQMNVVLAPAATGAEGIEINLCLATGPSAGVCIATIGKASSEQEARAVAWQQFASHVVEPDTKLLNVLKEAMEWDGEDDHGVAAVWMREAESAVARYETSNF